MHKGLIFDLDGVIVDTAKYHYMAWKEIANELQIDFDEYNNEKLKGVSRINSLEIILALGKKELTTEEKEHLCQKKNLLYINYIMDLKEHDVLQGVKKFIEKAKKEGYKIALGSASKNALIILEKLALQELFDVIIDGVVVSNAKPDPEVFEQGALKLGLENSECIVFEDSEAGIEAAHRCGMVVVGVGDNKMLKEANICINEFHNIDILKIEKMLLGA